MAMRLMREEIDVGDRTRRATAEVDSRARGAFLGDAGIGTSGLAVAQILAHVELPTLIVTAYV